MKKKLLSFLNLKKSKFNENDKHEVYVSSYRINGRFEGLLSFLFQKSGRDTDKMLKDIGYKLVESMKICDEFPEETKIMNKLSDLEKELKNNPQEKNITKEQQEVEILLGVTEALGVCRFGKIEDLLELKDIKLKS
jgi:translation initiation factor 2 alpha subunit (eIF-2alpha)